MEGCDLRANRFHHARHVHPENRRQLDPCMGGIPRADFCIEWVHAAGLDTHEYLAGGGGGERNFGQREWIAGTLQYKSAHIVLQLSEFFFGLGDHGQI
jgi:hypothetical protein